MNLFSSCSLNFPVLDTHFFKAQKLRASFVYDRRIKQVSPSFQTFPECLSLLLSNFALLNKLNLKDPVLCYAYDKQSLWSIDNSNLDFLSTLSVSFIQQPLVSSTILDSFDFSLKAVSDFYVSQIKSNSSISSSLIDTASDISKTIILCIAQSYRRRVVSLRILFSIDSNNHLWVSNIEECRVSLKTSSPPRRVTILSNYTPPPPPSETFFRPLSRKSYSYSAFVKQVSLINSKNNSEITTKFGIKPSNLQTNSPSKTPKLQTASPSKTLNLRTTSPSKTLNLRTTSLSKTPKLQTTSPSKTPKLKTTSPSKTSKLRTISRSKTNPSLNKNTKQTYRSSLFICNEFIQSYQVKSKDNRTRNNNRRSTNRRQRISINE